MPLISPLEKNHNKEISELADFFNETLGFCPNSVLTMQRRPEIAKAFINLNKAVMKNEGNVTAEQKRLIAYLTSANTGCRYCQAHTVLAAERYGASQQRIAAIWDFRTSDLFTEAEKIAFEFALAASSVPNAVDSSFREKLLHHWTEDDVIEILGVISLFGYLNRWNDSMSTTLETNAIKTAEKHLKQQHWDVGKHQ